MLLLVATFSLSLTLFRSSIKVSGFANERLGPSVGSGVETCIHCILLGLEMYSKHKVDSICGVPLVTFNKISASEYSVLISFI